MLWNQLKHGCPGLGFLRPVILFVVLCALAVPVWAAIGSAAIMMLIMSGALPLSQLVGESLFDGIDHFALTASRSLS
jgi:C4-dicarboxylate transporter DctM subunit